LKRKKKTGSARVQPKMKRRKKNKRISVLQHQNFFIGGLEFSSKCVAPSKDTIERIEKREKEKECRQNECKENR
jgi:hypothetical protein